MRHPYIQLRRHTFESHFGWIRVGSPAYTLHCGWQSRPHWVGEHGHTCPWWCSANLQTCTCPAGRPPRSGPRESNAGRRHMPYHRLVQCSCPGTGGDSTRPYPCTPSSHTSLDTLEKKNTNIERNISCWFKRRVRLCKSTKHVLRMIGLKQLHLLYNQFIRMGNQRPFLLVCVSLCVFWGKMVAGFRISWL